jgi:geranylgeranyl diphosphate synthase type I
MFEYAAFGGAIVGGGTERQQKALQQFGKNLGIGFQIWDDCLDVIGADIGKPVGSDIREGKRTLLYLYAKAHSEDTAWQQTYGDKDASDGAVRDVVEHLKKIGAVAYAQKCAAAYVTAAQEALLTLPDSEARTTLLSMADFAVNREK